MQYRFSSSDPLVVMEPWHLFFFIFPFEVSLWSMRIWACIFLLIHATSIKIVIWLNVYPLKWLIAFHVFFTIPILSCILHINNTEGVKLEIEMGPIKSDVGLWPCSCAPPPFFLFKLCFGKIISRFPGQISKSTVNTKGRLIKCLQLKRQNVNISTSTGEISLLFASLI